MNILKRFNLSSYPAIDWKRCIDEEKLSLPKGGLMMNDDAPHDHVSLLQWLVPRVQAELLKRPTKGWPREFEHLKGVLQEQLTITQYTQHEFTSDYNVFVYFTYVSLNEKNKTTFYDESAQNRSTQRMLKGLVEARLQAILKADSLSTDTLLQSASELSALTHLITSPSTTAPQTRYWADIKAQLIAWFIRLFNALKAFFCNPSSLTSLYELSESARYLWDLTKTFDLDAYLEPVEVRELLFKAYQQTIDTMEASATLTPRIDSCLLIKESSTFSFFGPSLATQLSRLNEAVTSDLNALTHWGSSYFRRAMLTYQSSAPSAEQAGVAQYLEAFQLTQQRVDDLSARLYVYRNRLESTFRRSMYYDSNLESLNTAMLAIDGQLIALQRAWLDDIKKILPGSELAKASRCLDYLLSAPVRGLECIAWAEHTAYCSTRTEESVGVKFEMAQQLNVEQYCLDALQTQSDYVVNHYWTGHYKRIRQHLPTVYPDTSGLDATHAPIAAYCLERYIRLRDRAEKLTRLWNLSQWGDLSHAPKVQPDIQGKAPESSDAPATVVDEEDEKVEVIDPPETALTLSCLQLNQDYLAWAKTHSLTKDTQSVGAARHLYNGKDEPALIAMFNYAKRDYKKNIKIVRRKEKEERELEAERIMLKASIAENKVRKEAALRRVDASRRETEVILASMEATMMRMIDALIEDQVEKIKTLPTPEFILNLKPFLLKKMVRNYPNNFKDVHSEDLSRRVDSRIAVYIQSLQTSSLSNNPEGFLIEDSSSPSAEPQESQAPQTNEASNGMLRFFVPGIVAAAAAFYLKLGR